MNKGAHVLIVDDQEGIRKLLAEACSMIGYHAHTAASGNEALDIITNTDIGAALIDLKMPGLNGITTLRMIKEIKPAVRTFLMTGYGETYLLDEALDHGAQGIILKPFDLDEILGLLESI